MFRIYVVVLLASSQGPVGHATPPVFSTSAACLKELKSFKQYLGPSLRSEVAWSAVCLQEPERDPRDIDPGIVVRVPPPIPGLP